MFFTSLHARVAVPRVFCSLKNYAVRSLAFLALTVGTACSAPPVAAPTSQAAEPAQLKVALISTARINDKGYNQAIWEGLQQAEATLDAEIKPVEVLNQDLLAKNIDDQIAQGVTVIVTVGPNLQLETLAAAQRHPTVSFIGVDQPQTEALPNLASLLFHEEQAGYLAGVLAASMSKSGQVGAILGTDVLPQLWAFGEGFRKGAQDEKPSISVSLIYHNTVEIAQSFSDPAWGRAQAITLMDQGVDVIFTAAGATGVGALGAVAGRKAAGAMAIGVDTDQYYSVVEARPILLSSSMKLLDKGILNLLTLIRDGSFEGGTFYGTVGLAPFHDFEGQVPAEVARRLSELQQQLETGQLTIELPARPAP